MSHKVVIKIDTNEGALIELLGRLPPKNNIIIKQLPVGDVLFIVDDVPALLIERKDSNDFRGSVADGRFREQRSRMVDLRKEHPQLTLCFLFEGSFSGIHYNPASRIQQRTLEDLANDLGPKYNICRVQSINVMDTLRLIGRYENVFKEKGPTGDIVEASNITEEMSIGKKRGIDQESFAPCALSLVPGLSREAAMSIAAVYPTLLRLITSYEGIADQKTREELLVGFQYGENLSIGPTVSKRVYHFLMDVIQPPKTLKRKTTAPSDPALKRQKNTTAPPETSKRKAIAPSDPAPKRQKQKKKNPFVTSSSPESSLSGSFVVDDSSDSDSPPPKRLKRVKFQLSSSESSSPKLGRRNKRSTRIPKKPTKPKAKRVIIIPPSPDSSDNDEPPVKSHKRRLLND